MSLRSLRTMPTSLHSERRPSGNAPTPFLSSPARSVLAQRPARPSTRSALAACPKTVLWRGNLDLSLLQFWHDTQTVGAGWTCGGRGVSSVARSEQRRCAGLLPPHLPPLENDGSVLPNCENVPVVEPPPPHRFSRPGRARTRTRRHAHICSRDGTQPAAHDLKSVD